MRLAHLSDIHFGGENAAAVAGCLEHLAREPVDLTVITGDLTRWGEKVEFEAARRWMDAIPGPVLSTAGNHDAPYLAWAERIVAPFARYRRHVGAPGDSGHLGPDFQVRTVNTARGAQPRLNWSKGQIARGQAAAAIQALARNPAAGLAIVACHHPLMEMIGGPMTARVWGGSAAAAAFVSAGVELVLSGHIHAAFALPFPCGDQKTYAVGAGTLSMRERGEPAGFNIVEADAAAIRVTALGWTGSHFEPRRTWSLDRRDKDAAAA